MGDAIGTTASIEKLLSISLNPIKRTDGRIKTTIVSEITTNNLIAKMIINNKIAKCFFQATRTNEKLQKNAI